MKLQETIEMICEKWGGDQLQGYTVASDAAAIYATREGLERQGKMIEENYKLLSTDPDSLTPHEQEIFSDLSEWIQEKISSGRYPGIKLMAILPREDGDFSMESFEIN